MNYTQCRIHNVDHHHYHHLTRSIEEAITDRILSLKYKPESKYEQLLSRWSSLRSSPS
ncbi:predicted protein [Arabidopsis lyrata subsp. lyrata]|uniref:Predicted protein n=1 Tax=Arabidopsis lyrata subsp. lyrata TaxID=81972 RepID=D7LB77_ARALL|nr:predicted protein [Arabidopsis lyrata subsp. lyrata]